MSEDHRHEDNEDSAAEEPGADQHNADKADADKADAQKAYTDREFESIMQRLSPGVRRIIEEGPTLNDPSPCNHCGVSGEKREGAGCFGGGYLEVNNGGRIEAHRCPHAGAMYRRQRIARAAETSGTGRLGTRQTFAAFDPERCSDGRTRRAAEILANLADDAHRADEELDRPARGVLLIGSTGTGKSHLLRAATIEAIDRGVPARFLEVHRLIGTVQDSYNERPAPASAQEAAPVKSRTQILDEIAAAEIVCLDDLGSEQHTEHTSQILFELLDRLEADQRVLVVATNLDGDDIEARYGSRVSSRILGMCARLNLASEHDHRA